MSAAGGEGGTHLGVPGRRAPGTQGPARSKTGQCRPGPRTPARRGGRRARCWGRSRPPARRLSGSLFSFSCRWPGWAGRGVCLLRMTLWPRGDQGTAVLPESGSTTHRGPDRVPQRRVADGKMETRWGRLATLNCWRRRLEICLLGEFTSQRGPRSGFLALIWPQRRDSHMERGSEGWRLRAGHQTRASHGGQAGSIASDPCGRPASLTGRGPSRGATGQRSHSSGGQHLHGLSAL